MNKFCNATGVAIVPVSQVSLIALLTPEVDFS